MEQTLRSTNLLFKLAKQTFYHKTYRITSKRARPNSDKKNLKKKTKKISKK